jgi:hypothetical protein
MPVYGKPRTEGVDLRRRAAFAAGGRRPTDGFSQQRREAFAAQGPQPLANIGQPSPLPKPVLPPGATMATANPPGAAYGQYQPSMQSPGQSFGPSTMPGMPAMPKPMSPPPVGGPMPPNWGPMQGPNAYQGYADPNRSMADPAMREQQVRLQQAMNKQNAFQAGLPDRMAQFDMRQAQQNATGRANAFRKTQFGGDAPMSGGHYAAPFVQPGVQMGQSQPGQIGAGMPQGLPQPDGTRLGDAYAAAMGGQLRPGAMPPGMPMTQPGSGGSMFGQGQRDGGVTRDQYGFAEGRPQSRQNVQIRPGTPPLASMEPGKVVGQLPGTDMEAGAFVHRNTNPIQSGVAGSGMSVVSPRATSQGSVSLRDWQKSPEYKSQVQAQADRLRPGIQANNLRKNDLRALARARKSGVAPDKELLTRMGGGKGGYASVAPAPGTQTIPVDQAVEQVGQADPKVWGMITQSPLGEAQPDAVVAGLDSGAYRGMSAGVKQKVQADVESYIAAQPDMDVGLAAQMRALARGKKRHEAAAAASMPWVKEQSANMQRSNSFPNF